MVRLLSIGIGVSSTALVLLPVMILLRVTMFRQYPGKKSALVFLYAVYLSGVFTAVGIPSVNNLTVHAEFNWIPVVDIVNSPAEYVKNTVLNVILFIPLGFFLPAIWDRYRSLKRTSLIGLGLSFVIESLQIFTFRLTDIDDLITNTIGTILGYYLFKYLSGRIQWNVSDSRGKYEPFAVCGIVFLVMFLIQPFLSGWMWEYVLSSPIWERVR